MLLWILRIFPVESILKNKPLNFRLLITRTKLPTQLTISLVQPPYFIPKFCEGNPSSGEIKPRGYSNLWISVKHYCNFTVAYFAWPYRGFKESKILFPLAHIWTILQPITQSNYFLSICQKSEKVELYFSLSKFF